MKHKTRLAGALAAIALAAGMTLAGTGVARADVLPPAGWSEIYSPYLHGQGLTLCFDDPAGSTASGTQVQLYHCHGYAANGTPQRWVFIPVEDKNGNPIDGLGLGHPLYEIFNIAAGQCLATENLKPGTPVVFGTCNRVTDKDLIWWEPADGGSVVAPDFELLAWPTDTGLGDAGCAAAASPTGSNNTRLVMEPCDRSNRVVFRLG